jgi:hypothetical protein
LSRSEGNAKISADGGFVALHSWDDGLCPPTPTTASTGSCGDRTSGALERVSVDSAGTQGNDWSLGASITPDARYVTFHSFADN